MNRLNKKKVIRGSPNSNIPQQTYTAIDLQLCQDTRITGNTINRYNSDPSVSFVGIKGNNLTFLNSIRHNHLIDYQVSGMTGINLTANVVGVQMECNDFQNCDKAVLIGTSGTPAVLLTQGAVDAPGANMWEPLDNSFDRIIDNVTFMDWYFSDTGSTTFSNGTWPQAPNFNIFQISTPDVANVCFSPNPFSFDLARDIDQIVNEEIAYPMEYFDEYNYNVKASLCQVFYTHYDDWMNETEYANWFSSIQESNLGKLEYAEKLIFEPNPENGDLGTAETILTQVTPENVIEENKLFLLNLFLTMIDEGNYLFGTEGLNSGTIEELNAIACQNSMIAGEAVLWSRTLLKLDIDDEFSCTELRKKALVSDDKRNSIALFPNPSTGLIQFNGENQSYQLKIVDFTGRVCFEKSDLVINSNYDTNLPNGTYFYHIHTKEGKSISGKLIVIK